MNGKGRPDWLIEGEAEWAGESVAGPSFQGQGWFANYLLNPGRPLVERTYDAVGFYAHLASIGISAWAVLDKMLLAPGDQASFIVSGANQDGFLDTWSSSMFVEPMIGSAWVPEGMWDDSKVSFDRAATGPWEQSGEPGRREHPRQHAHPSGAHG